MAVTATEDSGSTFPKGFSEWWSEETEYVFQRIERWAAFARGYNRLRSQRLSRGRLTMQEERTPRWTISSNKLVVDNSSWSPHFHTLKRSHRRRSRTEESKINCCGTFNYQSNSNLDSNCLETYRYDHSIYFKTIGEIRSSKRDLTKADQGDRISISSEEQVEWEAAAEDLEEVESINNNNNEEEEKVEYVSSGVWPIVDLSKLDINFPGPENPENNNNNDPENNLEELSENCEAEEIQDDDYSNQNTKLEDQDGLKSYLKKTQRPSGAIRQPAVIVGENNVLWPSVLLNYTKNIDPLNSPHHLAAISAK